MASPLSMTSSTMYLSNILSKYTHHYFSHIENDTFCIELCQLCTPRLHYHSFEIYAGMLSLLLKKASTPQDRFSRATKISIRWHFCILSDSWLDLWDHKLKTLQKWPKILFLLLEKWECNKLSVHLGASKKFTL